MEMNLIFIYSIACIHFRFNGSNPISPPEHPYGSHPHPIFRIEKSFFMLRDCIHLFQRLFNLSHDRQFLHDFLYDAMASTNIYWLTKYTNKFDTSLIAGGIITHENTKKYLPHITHTWDEIKNEILLIKRYRLVNSKNMSQDKNLPDLGIMNLDDYKKIFSTS